MPPPLVFALVSDERQVKQRTGGGIGERYDDLKYSTGALVNHSKQMTKRNGNKICFSAYIRPVEGLRAPRQMLNCHIRKTRKETLASVARKPRKAGEQEQ